MKRLRARSLSDDRPLTRVATAEEVASFPPLGLPTEIWIECIVNEFFDSWLKRNSYHIMGYFFTGIRCLRLTCRWFADNIPKHKLWRIFEDRVTHEAWWPAVEDLAKFKDGRFLLALEWPTHRRAQLDSYVYPEWSETPGKKAVNISYVRAGNQMAKHGDIACLTKLAHYGKEIWLHWVIAAIDAGQVELLRHFYNILFRDERLVYLEDLTRPYSYSMHREPEFNPIIRAMERKQYHLLEELVALVPLEKRMDDRIEEYCVRYKVPVHVLKMVWHKRFVTRSLVNRCLSQGHVELLDYALLHLYQCSNVSAIDRLIPKRLRIMKDLTYQGLKTYAALEHWPSATRDWFIQHKILTS